MGDLEWPAPPTKAVTTNDTSSPRLRNPEAASTRGCLCSPSPSSFPQKVKKPHNNIKEASIIRKFYFPSCGRKIKSFLSFALAVRSLWMKFPDDSYGTWSANLFSPEQVPGSWRDSRAPSASCPGSQSKVTPACGTCGWDSPSPPALCSFQTHPCLWTSFHFQTDSMCYLQGIVSKISPNLKWGGCFPSATLTLRTAEPQSGQFPSWWLWAKTRDAQKVKFQADEEAERTILQSLSVPEFLF